MKINFGSQRAFDKKNEYLIGIVLLSAGILLFTVAYSYLALTRHQTFNSTGYDLAIMEQIVWNTAQGDYFASSLEVDNSFADHFRPMLGLLVPFYLLYPRPEFLLIFQVVGLALGALPVYLLAHDKLNSVWAAVGFAAVYLLTPALGFIIRFDFHIEFLAIPAFVAAILYIEREQWRWVSFWLVIPLLCKENMGLSVAAVGSWMIAREWQALFEARFNLFITSREMVRVRFGLLWVIIGLLTFGLTSFVIIPSVRGEDSDSLSRYAWFFEEDNGPVVERAAAFLQTPPRPETLWQTFGATGFLAVLALPELIMVAPGLAQNLLAEHFCQPTIYCHYTTPVIPFIIVASILAVYRISRRWLIPYLTEILTVIAVVAAIFFWRQDNPFEPVPFLPGWENPPDNHAVVEQALAVVPPAGSLVTTNDYAPHLARRRELYVIGLPSQRDAPVDPELIFLNLYDQQYIVCDQIKMYIDQLEVERYGTLFRTGGLIVIARDQGDPNQYADFVNNWNNCAG
ncbi:MAG: DUF2079 domain-containing protein [Chloroflexota bacterium]